MRKTRFVHKHGYSFLFRNPVYMQRLLRDFVNKDLADSIDFKTATVLTEKSYVTEE